MVDRLDRKILQILQEDATVPVAEIGRRVGLSTTPCWRRIQKLEEDGVIIGRVALLDPKKVNTRVTAFVSIITNQHNDEWLRRFAEVIREFPEVVEFYRMAGQVDYLLRVVVPDIEAYDAFYKRLIAKIEISDVSSSFAMEQIKYTTALPLSYVLLDKEKASVPDVMRRVGKGAPAPCPRVIAGRPGAGRVGTGLRPFARPTSLACLFA